MRDNEIAAAWHGLAACDRCGIRDLVLFADLTNEDFSSFHMPIEDIWVPPGAALFQPGQEALALYTVREGLFKLEQYLPDGSHRIVNLMAEGDVLGLETTVSPVHEHAAIALQPSKVCRIPRGTVARLSPKLHRQLMAKWHQAMQRSHQCARDLSTGNARQKVARLFLTLAPPTVERCRLFAREDVGALLSITPQTASRTIAEFKRQKLVREVALNVFQRDIAALQAIAIEAGPAA
ncbi:fumarate and nitrate reduction regulatory protein [mine drainage metagenome]|uniref:Fumarate and nitrate reduction regulatory protein n=1 Tax=mine drainage metagenome TaxID=410659 RepID=A0A1J5Q0D1_9ZZZZ